MTQHKIKETYSYTHKGITIYVRIDYINNKISILECIDGLGSSFKKKDFTFINRGVEYMQGWRNILEAVSEATKDAQKKYEANLAEESKFHEKDIEHFEKMLVEVDQGLQGQCI